MIVYALYTKKFGYWSYKGEFGSHDEAVKACHAFTGGSERCLIKPYPDRMDYPLIDTRWDEDYTVEVYGTHV